MMVKLNVEDDRAILLTWIQDNSVEQNHPSDTIALWQEKSVSVLVKVQVVQWTHGNTQSVRTRI